MADFVMRADVADAVKEILSELATEIDMYYLDEQLPAAGPALKKMRTLIGFYNEAGYETPDECTHILNRYQKFLN